MKLPPLAMTDPKRLPVASKEPQSDRLIDPRVERRREFLKAMHAQKQPGDVLPPIDLDGAP